MHPFQLCSFLLLKPVLYILARFTMYRALADCECLHYAKHFLPAQTSRDQSMSIPIPSANQCHSFSTKTESNRKALFLKPCMLNQHGRNVLKFLHPTLYHRSSIVISVQKQRMKVDMMIQQNKRK